MPRWLGTYQGANTLRDRVCQACNQQLGRNVDNYGGRTGLEALERHRRGIDGRHDKRQSPFNFKTQEAVPPTTLMARSEGFEVPLLMEETGRAPDGTRMAQPISQIIVRAPSGQPHAVPLPTEMEWLAAADWLRKALVNRGLTGSYLVRILCKQPDGVTKDSDPRSHAPTWLQRALNEVFPGAEGLWVHWVGTGDTRLTAAELILGLGPEYMRAVAKLAFHYALRFLADLDGHDETLAPLKAFIKEGTGLWSAFVEPAAPQFILTARSAPPSPGHYFMVGSDSSELAVTLRTFAGSVEGAPMRVKLGTPKNSAHLRRRGHYLSLVPQPDGHDGQLFEREPHFVQGRWGVLAGSSADGR